MNFKIVEKEVKVGLMRNASQTLTGIMNNKFKAQTAYKLSFNLKSLQDYTDIINNTVNIATSDNEGLNEILNQTYKIRFMEIDLEELLDREVSMFGLMTLDFMLTKK